MKAFLLAAGLGTRLRPLTEKLPKCLLPINGKPMLSIWLEHLKRHGIDDVLINTHHLADKVKEFVGKGKGKEKEGWPCVHLFHEPKLLGSGGTVWANRDFVGRDEDFFIIYADNLTNVDLSDMALHHRDYRRHGGLLTMGLFRSATPEACGIAEMEDIARVGQVDDMSPSDGMAQVKETKARAGLIVGFEEKPKQPKSNLANGGIYVANKKIFTYFPDGFDTPPYMDFGFHILPGLVGQMYGYIIDSLLIDIGTIENYERAQRLWGEKEKN